MNLYVVTLQPV